MVSKDDEQERRDPKSSRTSMNLVRKMHETILSQVESGAIEPNQEILPGLTAQEASAALFDVLLVVKQVLFLNKKIRSLEYMQGNLRAMQSEVDNAEVSLNTAVARATNPHKFDANKE